MRYRKHLSLRLALWFLLVALAGCTQAWRPSGSAARPPVVRGDEFVVVIAGKDDSLSSLAYKYYGDARKSWQIADFNNIGEVSPGTEVVIPLRNPNPLGVTVNGYQTVPILCYHRFGPRKDKMVVSAEDFSAQMAYLRDNGYRVIPLSDLIGFFKGERALPRRAVVVTVDDGYRSTYEVAYPIMKKFNIPATVFVYSDFVGGGDAMNWDMMREMIDSGLVDIQTHSKAHSDLAIKQPGESDAAYRKRVEDEVTVPTRKFNQMLGRRLHTFAFPYGDGNPLAVELIKSQNYEMAATVQPGGNAFYSYPYLLRRTMIFGDQSLESFKKALDTFAKVPLQ